MTTATPGEHEHARLGPSEPQQQRGRIPADTFASRLVLARRLDGLTIREAAEKSGIHYATWSTWEAGRRPADILDVAARIAEALDINEEWLLFGGPLSGSRSRLTRRLGEDTHRYRSSTVRPPDNRPVGRPITRTAPMPEVRQSRVIRDPLTEAPAPCVR